jgi:uncharacterized phage protein (TIGR01671 family)
MNRFKCPACGRNQYTSADTAQGCIYCGNKELKKMEILEPKEGEGMREIKFRGKRLDNGEWVYGYYYTQIITHAGNRKSRDHFMRTEQNIRYEVDPSTVGQFTGLKDKNGKEIYEGDVVRIDDLGIGIVDYEEGRFAMRRREERFCWPVYCRIDHSPFVPEVIGNIYENPEVLEGE